MSNVKIVLKVFGGTALVLAVGMTAAELFFEWSPAIIDQVCRGLFVVFGLVALSVDGFLPG